MAETYPRSYAQYLLLERLGSGGMSEVDLARTVVDEGPGERGTFVRFAVIKRIKADKTADEAFIRMFKDEARITSELHHEKIGTVYDFGKCGDEYYLALEYIPGVDVRFLVNALRERGQRVPVKVALRIVVDVLEALDYAHNKKDTFGKRMGIVHRDVNPRNVMLSIRGDVKLIDFGVAKAADRLERTRTDHVKGKFSYMAPEQISGLSTDHRADLYAAGLLLHELLSGSSPFYGLNQVQILHRMVSGKVPTLPAVPEIQDPTALAAIHAKALAQSPSDRYPSAADMAADLRTLGKGLGGLPTNDQLAAFLAAVDPELTARLQFKMESYARAETSQPLTLPAGLREAALPESNSTLAPETDSFTVTRIGVLGGSFVLVSLLSGLFAAVFVSVVIGGLFFWFRPAEPVPPIPVAVIAAPAPASAVPVPAVPVEPAPVALQAAPIPQAVAPSPVVRSAPTPQPVVVAAPDPVVAAPVPEPAVVPVPEPAPAPVVAVDMGFLNVVSDPRGSPIQLDGADLGKSTPLERYKVAVGRHTVGATGMTCSPATVTIGKSQVVNVSCR